MKRLSIEKGDKFAGAVLAGIGAAAIAEAVRMYPYASSAWVGDHTAPALLGTLLLIFGIATALRGPKTALSVELPSRHTALRMLNTFIVLSAYCVCLPVIGYAASTCLVTSFLFRFQGVHAKLPMGKRWAAIAGWSLLTTVLLYYIFGVWLSLPLPNGLWNSL